jgi:pimeloyl-ACP methyl ester carboxylesterase
MRDVLDYLGIGQAAVIASSFGGSAAIDYALAYPGQISKLILVAPSVNGMKYPFRLAWKGMMDYMRVKRIGITKAAEHFMNNSYWSYIIPQDAKRREAFKRLYVSNEIFYQGKPSLHKPLEPHAVNRLEEIKQPVLILEAERDLPFNKGVCAMLHEKIPDSQKIVMPGCGHYPHLERPLEFLSAIQGFL